MKNAIFFLLLIMQGAVMAQNNPIVMRPVTNKPVCVGEEMTVSFSISGTFSSQNEFRVQISDKNGNNFRDIGVSGNSTPIKFRMPETLAAGNYYRVRVVSTSPAFLGVPSEQFPIRSKPTAHLSAEYLPSEINAHEDVRLKINFTGGAYYKFTLSDSSAYESNIFDEHVIIIRPERAANYTITQVSNDCGTGTTSGSVMVNTNPFGLKILGLMANQYCKGGKIQLLYTANGTINPDNKFRLSVGNSRPDQEQIIDLTPDPVVKNQLNGTLPENLSYSNLYSIRLLASSPALVSNYYSFSTSDSFYGYTYIGMDYYTDTQVIEASGSYGVQPFTLAFSDGTLYSGVTRLSIPIQAQTYKKVQVSISDQCGSYPSMTDSLEISGSPYMWADTLPTRAICGPEQIALGFKSNMVFKPGTKLTARFHRITPSSVSPYSYEVPVRIEGENLIFTTPEGARGMYFVKIVIDNNEATAVYAQGEIELSAPPGLSMNLETTNYSRLTFPGAMNPTKAVVKINDDEITLSRPDFIFDEDSRVYYYPVSSTKPSVYTLLAVENACGTNTGLSEDRTRAISNPETRQVVMGNLPKTSFCKGEELSIPFRIEGTLTADETIDLIALSGTLVHEEYYLASSRISPIKVLLNDQVGGKVSLVLRIRNTKVSSETRAIELKSAANLIFSVLQANSNPVMTGQKVGIQITPSGVLPITYTLNGKPYTIKERMYEWGGDMLNSYIFPTENQKFEIRNVRNDACGVNAAANKTVNLEVVPVKIMIDDYNATFSNVICTNMPMSVTFKAYGYTRDTRFVAQVSDANGGNFRDINIIRNGNPMTVSFPQDLTRGTYLFRLGAVMNGKTYYSSSRSITVSAPGTATLSAPGGGSTILMENGYASLDLSFTGSLPWNFFISKVQKDISFGSTSPTTRLILYPKANTTYQFLEAFNACGYSPISGKVTVTVPLSVNLSRISPYEACVGQKVEFGVELTGNFIGNEELTFYASTSSRDFIELGKAKLPLAGNLFSFTIPQNMAEGFYNIHVRINDKARVQLDGKALIVKVPAEGSLKGNTIINSGGQGFVTLSTKGSPPVDYQLNDGTWGSIDYTHNVQIPVSPVASTTYQLKAVSNFCGSGTVGGTASVTVNPPSDRQITTFFDNYSGYVCSGSPVAIRFTTKGSFTASNKFQLQMSDQNGENYKTITGMENISGTINFVVPQNQLPGKFYRFRVIATDPNTASSTTDKSLEVIGKASVTMSSVNTVINSIGENVSVKFDLTGSPPWRLSISDSLRTVFNYSTTIYESPYIFTFKPEKLFVLKVNDVQNDCGAGTINAPQYIRIEILTATEATESWSASIFPNPSGDFVNIRHETLKNGIASIINMSGQTVLTQKVEAGAQGTLLKIQHLPAGIYLLNLDGENKRKVWKIIKE